MSASDLGNASSVLYPKSEPVRSKAEQRLKLAHKIQTERGWDFTRGWTEARQRHPDLMSEPLKASPVLYCRLEV